MIKHNDCQDACLQAVAYGVWPERSCNPNCVWLGIDTADHVHHEPSGEEWVVAYVRNGKLAWCGWPCGEANLSDCRLIRKATDAERDRLLREMSDCNDPRGSYARERLGMTQ